VQRSLKPPFVLKRVVNPALTALGVGTILITYGRRSGRRHQVPVNLLTVGDVDYLVASWGVTDWSRNLVANPDAELRQGRNSQRIRAVPVPDVEKPPLIVAYLRRHGAAGLGFSSSSRRSRTRRTIRFSGCRWFPSRDHMRPWPVMVSGLGGVPPAPRSGAAKPSGSAG
jgi:deazaflavin-dependent oxidoreductase (nitroreductase family)